MGVGTWAWGDADRGFGSRFDEGTLAATLHEAAHLGIRLVDTAERYGEGRAETMLGRAAASIGHPLFIASKCSPRRWEWPSISLRRHLGASLKRLQRPSIELYQIHWPLRWSPISRWMDAMADVYDDGLVQAVGVCNYSIEQALRARDVLARRRIPLTSVQVEFHLLRRHGSIRLLVDRCRTEGIRVLAYSPLAHGFLSEAEGGDARRHYWRERFGTEALADRSKIISLLREIGERLGGRTPVQVALQWIVAHGAIPLVGAWHPAHIREAAGALEWRLTDEDRAALETMPTAA